MTSMQKTHRNLIGLLGLQVLLAAILAWRQYHQTTLTGTQRLFAFNEKTVDQLVIEGSGKTKVDLVRKKNQWDVVQAGNFPADTSRVNQLLDNLNTMTSDELVATSSHAAERFKVADANFERRIVVEVKGKPIATLLMGSMQGARRAYVRKFGTSEVYTAKLTTYDVPTTVDDWLDKTVLHIPYTDITGINVNGLKLTYVPASVKTASVWRAEGLKPDEQVNSSAVDRLTQEIAGLQFEGILENKDEVRKSFGDVELQIGVQRKNGQHIDYTLRKLKKGDNVALLLSNRPEAFTLTLYQAKVLTDAAARKSLVLALAASASKK